jgi:hypothetical protein
LGGNQLSTPPLLLKLLFTGKIRKVVIEVGPLKLGAVDMKDLEKREAARKATE